MIFTYGNTTSNSDNNIKFMRMMILTYGNTTSYNDTSNYDYECIIAKTKNSKKNNSILIIILILILLIK